MTDNILSKVITTGSMGGQTANGILNPTQSDRFIDYMFDETVFMPQVRKVRMNSDVMDIDKIGIGRRVLRGATEAVDDGINIGVAFTKVTLTTTKFRADMELSTDVLEDNVEGDSLEDHIARLLAHQIGQDLEDVAINGNKASADPLLHHLDGWGIRGEVDGNVVEYDADTHSETPTDGGQTFGASRNLLDAMISKMPGKFKSRGDLKFFAHPDLVQDWTRLIGEAAANAQNFNPRAELNVDSRPGAAGYQVNAVSGLQMQEVPLLEGHDVWLTFPQNLVWGTRREIKVYTEFKPKADTTEYTVFTRVAAAVEEPDAFVVAKDVPTRA